MRIRVVIGNLANRELKASATCYAQCKDMVNNQLILRLQSETLSRHTFAVKAGPFPGKKP